MQSIAIVIVIYRQSLDKIGLIQNRFILENKYKIFVYDNTEQSKYPEIIKKNKILSERMGINYYGCGLNIGISRAYNFCIDKLDKNIKWVVFFDQDTTINNNYFKILEKSIIKSNNLIYFPYVFDRKGILSPSKLICIFPIRIKSFKINNLKLVTAINSGLAVNVNVFNEVGFFNENLFLDFIDHDFIKRFKNEYGYTRIGILSVKIYQDFSDNSNYDKSNTLSRFYIFKKDFINYCKDKKLTIVFCYIALFKRVLKLTFKFKSLDFFKAFLKRV